MCFIIISLIRKEQKCIVCGLINIPLLLSLAPSLLSVPFPVVSAGERCVITWEISGYGDDWADLPLHLCYQVGYVSIESSFLQNDFTVISTLAPTSVFVHTIQKNWFGFQTWSVRLTTILDVMNSDPFVQTLAVTHQRPRLWAFSAVWCACRAS